MPRTVNQVDILLPSSSLPDLQLPLAFSRYRPLQLRTNRGFALALLMLATPLILLGAKTEDEDLVEAGVTSLLNAGVIGDLTFQIAEVEAVSFYCNAREGLFALHVVFVGRRLLQVHALSHERNV